MSADLGNRYRHSASGFVLAAGSEKTSVEDGLIVQAVRVSLGPEGNQKNPQRAQRGVLDRINRWGSSRSRGPRKIKENACGPIPGESGRWLSPIVLASISSRSITSPEPSDDPERGVHVSDEVRNGQLIQHESPWQPKVVEQSAETQIRPGPSVELPLMPSDGPLLIAVSGQHS